MFCTKCGQQIPEQRAACPFCGAPAETLPAPPSAPQQAGNFWQDLPDLDAGQTQPIPTPQKFQHPQQPPVYPTPQPPVYRPAPAASRQPEKKSNTVILVLVIVLAVLLLAAAVGLVISLVRGSRQEEDPGFSYTVADGPRATKPAPETEAPTEAAFVGTYDGYYTDVDYIFPDSDRKYLAPGQLQGMNRDQLMLAYYEIEARHGATFPDQNLQAYFESKSWYAPGGTLALSETERLNQEVLQVNIDYLDGHIQHAVNAYFPFFRSADSQYNADSSSRYLTAEDLKYLSDIELSLMRNEIFARQGYIFESDDLRQYFFCKSWYVPRVPHDEFSNSAFSTVEMANINLIHVYEKLLGGMEMNSRNPYYYVYLEYGDWVFPNSSSQKLAEWELQGLSQEALIIARNEIYARNGYGYEDQDILAYFAQCYWYEPTIAPGRKNEVPLNATEKANVKLIEKYEAYLDELGDIPNVDSLEDELVYDIENRFFTLSLPAYWEDYCTIEEKSSNDGSYHIRFYEKFSHETMAGGHVFSIYVTKDLSQFDYYAGAQDFATLTSAEGDVWYVVVVEPTDVQWAEVALQMLYTDMYNSVEEILTTFYATNDYVLSRPYA